MLKLSAIVEYSIAAVLAIAAALAVFAHEPNTAPRSGKWPAVERAHLAAQPECQACGSKEQLNVHHVKPFHLYPELELSSDNLITLCMKHNCHFIFGHACDYKAWNPNVVADAKHARKMIEQRQYERVKE